MMWKREKGEGDGRRKVTEEENVYTSILG